MRASAHSATARRHAKSPRSRTSLVNPLQQRQTTNSHPFSASLAHTSGRVNPSDRVRKHLSNESPSSLPDTLALLEQVLARTSKAKVHHLRSAVTTASSDICLHSSRGDREYVSKKSLSLGHNPFAEAEASATTCTSSANPFAHLLD